MPNCCLTNSSTTYFAFYTSHLNSINATFHRNELTHYIWSPSQLHQLRHHSTPKQSFALSDCWLAACFTPFLSHKPAVSRCTCSFNFNLIGWTFPRRQSQVRLSTAKEKRAAVKRNSWVLLGYLPLHLWFYGWCDALRKWVWKRFVGRQGIMRLGSQK